MNEILQHKIRAIALRTLEEGHDLGTKNACEEATSALEEIEELLRPLEGSQIETGIYTDEPRHEYKLVSDLTAATEEFSLQFHQVEGAPRS